MVGTLGTVRRRLAATLVATAALASACGGSNGANHLERAAGSTTTTETTLEATTTTASTAPPTTAAPAPRPVTTRRTSPPPTAPAPPAPPTVAAVHAHLTQIASLQQPLAMAVRNGDPAFYIAQKSGQVVALRGATATTVLDLSSQVSTGGEQGLLGVAISPDGSTMLVNYTDNKVSPGDTHIIRYAMGPGGPDPATAREIFTVHQPYANHNGGNLVFGPDGALWVGLGDGGSGGDPNNNAQNMNTPLGKMLRMDPNTGQYSIWAVGLRNPWRYSFDRATGSVWIADVGQNMWEEIDFARGVQSAGMNFGWSEFEGNHVYNASRSAPNAVPPIYEYSHAGGNCAITGGYVYRGTRIPAMAGVYLFGDFCVGHVLGLGGGQVRDLGMAVGNLSSFGQDLNGELYALSLNGGVYRIDPS
jgi:glucose/arabinose dehydrogenase